MKHGQIPLTRTRSGNINEKPLMILHEEVSMKQTCITPTEGGRTKKTITDHGHGDGK